MIYLGNLATKWMLAYPTSALVCDMILSLILMIFFLFILAPTVGEFIKGYKEIMKRGDDK